MKKALTLLMLIIGISELLIMILIPVTLDKMVSNSWIKVLLDSLGLSMIAMLAFYLTIKPHWLTKGLDKNLHRSILAFAALKTATIIFLFEALLMFILLSLGDSITHSQTVVIDLIALIIFGPLLIYWLVLVPFKNSLSINKAPRDYSDIRLKSIFGYISFLLLIGFGLMSAHEQQVYRYTTQLSNKESLNLSLVRTIFLNRIQVASRDVLTISLMGDIHNWFETNSENSLSNLRLDFYNLARINPNFDQIRFIDKDGNEIVRVNQSINGVELVNDHQLQNKKSRYYFKETMELGKGQIFLSPLDLNIESGQIEKPIKPMIRIATVIIDKTGTKVGIAVVNFLGSQLLEDIEAVSKTMSGQVNLVNQQGYWLFGESEEKLWGFMYENMQNERFSIEKPDVWNTIKLQEKGVILVKKGTYIYDSVNFDSKQMAALNLGSKFSDEYARKFNKLKLISFISHEFVYEQLIEERNLLIFLFLLAILFGAVGMYIVVEAIMNSSKAKDQLFHLAHYDSLTDLANRRFFSEKLESEIAYDQRFGLKLVLFYMDLDRFKTVNDLHGHDAGDELLMQVAVRLKECFREFDTLARIGGDEFAAIVHRIHHTKEITLIAERVINRISQPFDLSTGSVKIGLSIGISVFDQFDSESESNIIRAADKAMYEAKQAGRNCYRIFSVAKKDAIE